MGLFTLVREADFKETLKIFSLIFLLYVTYIVYFKVSLVLCLGLALLGADMIIEDYREQTIDIINIILFAGLSFYTAFVGGRLIEAAAAASLVFMFFAVLRYATAKFTPALKETQENEEEGENVPEGFGLVPSLFFGAVICAWYWELSGDIPIEFLIASMEITAIASEMGAELFGLTFIALSFLLYFFRQRVIKKEKAGNETCYMMGDGDLYVLGIFAALFGMGFFYFQLTVSMILFTIYGVLITRIIKYFKGDYKCL